MNLYDSIKNPIENDEVLRELIEFYKTDENPRKNLYNKLIAPKDNREFDKEKYIKDYEELILRPTLEELYINIGTRVGLNEKIFGNNSSILKKIFKECPTYEEFRKKLEGITNKTQRNKLKKCFWVLTTPKEEFDKDNLTCDHQGWYEEAKEIFSDEEIYSLAPYVCLEEKMNHELQDSYNIMGFHVNAEKKMDLNKKNEKNELKFYINAGDDTCKVASLFRDKCESAKINYYFKVVNPYKDSLDRADRMCIYSEMKHTQDIFNILKEIKQENPQIEFEKPPMMVGNFDNWLGIASDYSGKKYDGTSYNVAMSHICIKALEKIFKETGQNKQDNKEIIEKLKSQLLIEAQNMEYAKDKICFNSKAKKTLEKVDSNRKNNKKDILPIENILSSLGKAKIRMSEIKSVIQSIKQNILNKTTKFNNQQKLGNGKKKTEMPTEQIEYNPK